MVQTSSIALFASVVLFTASPAFGAVLPNNKAGSSASTTARATTTTTTTKPTPTPASDASRWKQEQSLIEQLYKLESTKPNAGAKPLQNLKKEDKAKTTSSSAPSATQVGKVLSGKPVDKLAEKLRLNKLHDQKLRLEEQRERLKMAKLNQEIEHERLLIHGLDRERLMFEGDGASSEHRLNRRPSSNPASSTTTTTKPFALNRLGKPLPAGATIPPTSNPGKSFSAIDQARKESQAKVLIEDLERLMGGPTFKATRDLEDAQWVRGYDNSEIDSRDEGEAQWVRGYDNSENDARDHEEEEDHAGDDEESDADFARDDLEGFEYAVRDLDSDMEDFYQRYDFEGLEDLE